MQMEIHFSTELLLVVVLIGIKHQENGERGLSSSNSNFHLSQNCSVCKVIGPILPPPLYRPHNEKYYLNFDKTTSTAEQTSLNVSVGGQTKIPCPTVGPGEEENQVTDVRWQLPNGTILTHGRYKARVKKLDNGMSVSVTLLLAKK